MAVTWGRAEDGLRRPRRGAGRAPRWAVPRTRCTGEGTRVAVGRTCQTGTRNPLPGADVGGGGLEAAGGSAVRSHSKAGG